VISALSLRIAYNNVCNNIISPFKDFKVSISSLDNLNLSKFNS